MKQNDDYYSDAQCTDTLQNETQHDDRAQWVNCETHNRTTFHQTVISGVNFLTVLTILMLSVIMIIIVMLSIILAQCHYDYHCYIGYSN